MSSGDRVQASFGDDGRLSSGDDAKPGSGDDGQPRFGDHAQPSLRSGGDSQEVRAPSFDALYRSLAGPVGKLCLHVCGDKAAAEDAVQETFLAVHRSLPAFRGDSKASTWVYRIALRAALRSRARRASSELPLPEGLDAAGEHPERALEARDDARRVLAAMETLNAEQRAVLSLFAIEGLGHREIAEVLGVPEGTVWSRLHLARKKLAVALEPA